MSTKLIIENNVEIPNARGITSVMPLEDIKVNQSFFVPYGDSDKTKLALKVRGAINYWKETNDNAMKVTIRKTYDGIRVWRTA